MFRMPSPRLSESEILDRLRNSPGMIDPQTETLSEMGSKVLIKLLHDSIPMEVHKIDAEYLPKIKRLVIELNQRESEAIALSKELERLRELERKVSPVFRRCKARDRLSSDGINSIKDALEMAEDLLKGKSNE